MNAQTDPLWTGMHLIVKGLADAAKKASYCLGFGAIALGTALIILKRYEIIGFEATLVALGAFFIFARIGRLLDQRIDTFELKEKSEINDVNNVEELEEVKEQILLLEKNNKVRQFETEQVVADGINEIKQTLGNQLSVQQLLIEEFKKTPKVQNAKLKT